MPAELAGELHVPLSGSSRQRIEGHICTGGWGEELKLVQLLPSSVASPGWLGGLSMEKTFPLVQN